MQIDYEESLQKVYSSKKLLRLKDIIGFTGLGADFERKYIHDTAVYFHDLRVAEVCKQLLLNRGQYDSNKVQFIALTHDYSAFPFRQFAINGFLKELIESSGYNPKNRHIELLKEDGINLDESLISDVLNFDIALDKYINLTDEGRIAVSCESVVTVYEDIILALKYDIIKYEEIPGELLNRLNFPKKEMLNAKINGDFSFLIEDLSLNFCSYYIDNLESLGNTAREFKSYARRNLIVERIFKQTAKLDDIAQVSSLYEKYFEKFKRKRIDYNVGVFLNDLTTRTESFLLF